MNRLTEKIKIEDHEFDALPKSGVENVECFNGLSDYEDLGLTPGEIAQEINKAKKYEEDENAGLIAHLPVKYGEPLYEINEERATIEILSFTGFESVPSFGGALKPNPYGLGYIIGRKGSDGNKVYIYAGNIGKTVFTTRAEAEAALKILEVNGACTK